MLTRYEPYRKLASPNTLAEYFDEHARDHVQRCLVHRLERALRRRRPCAPLSYLLTIFTPVPRYPVLLAHMKRPGQRLSDLGAGAGDGWK